ncbi:MAG: YafY family transcriptional regulator [Anaerolineae bacterium]|nr:YafY family transcriptional regulator [Anaerolineae bacterium]
MRADRLLSMLMLLQIRGRMTAEELAEELEVSPRTIYRDLDALSIAGVPVYSERGPSGGISLLDDYRTNLTGLTRAEVRALFMFTVPGLFADLHADKTQEAATLKLLASLPAPFRQDAELARQRLHLDPAVWFQPAEPAPYLSLIQDAVWQNRRVRIVYRRGDGAWVKRLIDPYGLVAKTSVWYVVAGVLRMTLTFRISRIQEAVLTDSTFERSADFSLADYWANWCAQFEASHEKYGVTLRVAPAGIPSLVQMFGEGIHTLVEQAGAPDDEGCCTLTLTFESPEAACQKILGLGTAVEVIAPQALRKQMLNMAEQVTNLYTK